MSSCVKIDGDTAVFPGDACVHCLRPATGMVDLTKITRSGFRRVRVPFCDQCAALRKSKSRTQVLVERIGAILSLATAWTAGIWLYGRVLSWGVVAAERAWQWGVLLGGLALVAVFGSLYFATRQLSLRFRSLESKRALVAVRIYDFDWETTTLEFEDEAYADRFALVNQPGDRSQAPVQGG